MPKTGAARSSRMVHGWPLRRETTPHWSLKRALRIGMLMAFGGSRHMSRPPAQSFVSLRLLASIGAAWLTLSVAAADPFQLKDEVGRFAVTFPDEPTLDKAEGSSENGPHVHYTWGVDVEERHFSITYTEYAKPPAKNY